VRPSTSLIRLRKHRAGPLPVVLSLSEVEGRTLPAQRSLPQSSGVILEFSSLDRIHGFSVPDLGLKTTILPDSTVRVSFTPARAGSFLFHCDNFCGDGHEDMDGVIVVEG
jgi:cytochrome c oxidase subunit 2